MLIINADDFGNDALTNRAVVASFERGICQSATIMPNRPGFEEACQLAHERKLINYLGVHLVLDGSYPLVEKVRGCAGLCNNAGQLRLGDFNSFARLFIMLGAPEKALLAQEIRAQIRKCRAYKIPLTHIDSHRHIHTAWAVASIIMQIAKEEGIRFVRIARNLEPEKNIVKVVYKHFFNEILKKANLARSEYFGSIDDLLFFKKRSINFDANRKYEIMIHPCLDKGDILLDGANGMGLEKLIKQLA